MRRRQGNSERKKTLSAGRQHLLEDQSKELWRNAPKGWKYYASRTPGYRKEVSAVSRGRRWPEKLRQVLWAVGASMALSIGLIVLGHLGYIDSRPAILGIAAALPVVVALIVIGYRCRWTGFGNRKLWDWLQLLIVPVFIAVGGYFLTTSQQTYNMWVEDNRQQDNAVQTYIDQMMQLIVDGHLHDQENGDQIRTLARSRTLTVLNRLGQTRKQYILLFLSEADLITRGNVMLDLSYANLSGARLQYKDLRELQLSRTNLYDADLRDADLRYTDLSGADLTDADLSGADLSDADLSGAIVAEEQLSTVWSLEGAIMPDGSTRA